MLLEAFYEENKDKLISVLTRYSRDGEASKDAVQNSFLKALQNRGIFSNMNEKACWSWLYTTAKNALTDEKRKAARYDLLESFAEQPAADGNDDVSTEDALLVKELLHTLPSNLFHVVSLKYWAGLNASEIGKIKGIPAATVRTQLRAAMALMRKHCAR